MRGGGVPRERSPNRDRAYEIYKEHDGKITNREIASMLEEDEKVIAVWKSRDKWNDVQQRNKSCTTKKKGGQPGNKNAVGNKGGSAPKGNKNAVKTGEFERIFFDSLDPDEKRLVETVEADKERLLLQEIQLLTVRERRMLRRIDELKATSPDIIQSVEDSLTRVQARKQKAIDSLHKYIFDDSRLELEIMKMELEVAKNDTQEQDTSDDGFMDAMNAETTAVWGDYDD